MKLELYQVSKLLREYNEEVAVISKLVTEGNDVVKDVKMVYRMISIDNPFTKLTILLYHILNDVKFNRNDLMLDYYKFMKLRNDSWIVDVIEFSRIYAHSLRHDCCSYKLRNELINLFYDRIIEWNNHYITISLILNKLNNHIT